MSIFFRYILVPLRWTTEDDASSNFWRRQRHPFQNNFKIHETLLRRVPISGQRSFLPEGTPLPLLLLLLVLLLLFNSPFHAHCHVMDYQKNTLWWNFFLKTSRRVHSRMPVCCRNDKTDAYGHTTGNTPEPVRFQKLSLVRPS